MKDISNKYLKYGKQLYELTGGIIGYIVPAIEGNRYVERAFLKSSNPGVLSRPFAWVGFDMASGTLLYYKHCISEDFADSEKYPAGTKLKGEFPSPRTAKQQAEYEKQLWESYTAIREFVFKENLSDVQKALVDEYKKQWALTVMKDLIPYYEALSPEFFKWLNQ